MSLFKSNNIVSSSSFSPSSIVLNNNEATTTKKSSRDEQQPQQQQKEQKEQQKEQQSQQQSQQQSKARDTILNVWDLFDSTKPWVIVDNGSYSGIFDWVPMNYRIGPWNPVAKLYFACIVVGTAVFSLNFIATTWYESSSLPWFVKEPISQQQQQQQLQQLQQKVVFPSRLDYPQPFSSFWWYYNVTAFLWMVFIMYVLAFHSPLKRACWITYTVQSWTILTFRHLFCALAPISDAALQLAEYTRFPAAVSPTITFTIWNFILCPYVYFITMKTPQQKHNFYKFCTSFRLLNVHFLNIVLCVLNTKYSCPPRQLTMELDFYLALVSVVSYMVFYLCVLDRIGVHLYPIFSPRTPTIILFSAWTMMFTIYFGLFHFWKHQLLPSSK